MGDRKVGGRERERADHPPWPEISRTPFMLTDWE